MKQSQWEQELTVRAGNDVQYQLWLQHLRQLEPAYQKLRTTLTEERLDLLDSYISTCEEMDHTLIHLAYELGFAHGRRASFTCT